MFRFFLKTDHVDPNARVAEGRINYHLIEIEGE